MTGFLFLSDTTLYRVSNKGAEYAAAYLFVCRLRSLTSKHPIIFDFNANTARIRALLNLSEYKFRKLLNAAIRLHLAYYEGKHLRLFSRTQEKKQFKETAKSRYAVDPRYIDQAYQYFVLKKRVEKQEEYIKRKQAKATATKGKDICAINFDITLSIRNISRSLNVSTTKAHALTKHFDFGLSLKQRRERITYHQYILYKQAGDYHARRINGEFFYILASIPVFTGFKHIITPPTVKEKRTSYFDSIYW